MGQAAWGSEGMSVPCMGPMVPWVALPELSLPHLPHDTGQRVVGSGMASKVLQEMKALVLSIHLLCSCLLKPDPSLPSSPPSYD